jgi:hypothetical protein
MATTLKAKFDCKLYRDVTIELIAMDIRRAAEFGQAVTWRSVLDRPPGRYVVSLDTMALLHFA